MKKQYILRGFLTLAILLCVQALAGAQTTETEEKALVGEDVVLRRFLDRRVRVIVRRHILGRARRGPIGFVRRRAIRAGNGV